MVKKDLLKKLSKKDLEEENFFLAGYDNLYTRLERVVTKKGINNAIIVGDGGIGKTTLAKSLVFDETHEFYELQKDTLSDIIFSYQPDKNDIQSVKEIFQNINQAFILIDDIVSIFSEEYVFQNRLINLLNILLKNQKVSVIATIDQANFRLFIEKDPLLSKSFEIVRILEPVKNISTSIIQKHIPLLEKKYKVKISSDLANKTIVLSDRYIQTQKQPAKALSLLDETCNYVKQKQKDILEISDLKFIISEKTGIPVNEISLSDMKRLKSLEKIIKNFVQGQDHALKRIAKVIRRSRAGIKDPRRPSGSFLFLGPSGVGKTYLAKTLTKTVYNDEKALIRIDMSEFNESHNVQRLVGAPPGYVGYEEGGQLTNPVWERPYSLILLDEIEKAHPRVFDIFLQLIDEGRLTDGQGKTVDFNNTIIIATSNIGIEFITDNYSQKKDYVLSEEFVQREMMPILLQYFRPEFINRFDDIIVFKPLDVADLIKIAKLSIEELNERLIEKEIRINVKDETLEKLAKRNFNLKFGARPLKRSIRENIEDYIAHKIIFGQIERGTEINW